MLKESGAAVCNEPQYIVTKLGAGAASTTMSSNECDKYHKTFIPMMPLHAGHGDHLYESTRVGTGTFGVGGVPVLNSDEIRPIAGPGSAECDSAMDANSGLDPPDIQFVDILKPSLQQQQVGGATGTSSRAPRASDFHIYSHEEFPRPPPGCHIDTIICPIHQCHHHQQQQQLQHSVHSLVGQDDDTS